MLCHGVFDTLIILRLMVTYPVPRIPRRVSVLKPYRWEERKKDMYVRYLTYFLHLSIRVTHSDGVTGYLLYIYSLNNRE